MAPDNVQQNLRAFHWALLSARTSWLSKIRSTDRSQTIDINTFHLYQLFFFNTLTPFLRTKNEVAISLCFPKPTIDSRCPARSARLELICTLSLDTTVWHKLCEVPEFKTACKPLMRWDSERLLANTHVDRRTEYSRLMFGRTEHIKKYLTKAQNSGSRNESITPRCASSLAQESSTTTVLLHRKIDSQSACFLFRQLQTRILRALWFCVVGKPNAARWCLCDLNTSINSK